MVRNTTLLSLCAAILSVLVATNPLYARHHEDAAFAKDDRPPADYEQHEIRKVRDVLTFSGIGQGMTVVEMEAGGGMYTEVFAKTVGPEGTVHRRRECREEVVDVPDVDPDAGEEGADQIPDLLAVAGARRRAEGAEPAGNGLPVVDDEEVHLVTRLAQELGRELHHRVLAAALDVAVVEERDAHQAHPSRERIRRAPRSDASRVLVEAAHHAYSSKERPA